MAMCALLQDADLFEAQSDQLASNQVVADF